MNAQRVSDLLIAAAFVIGCMGGYAVGHIPNRADVRKWRAVAYLLAENWRTDLDPVARLNAAQRTVRP